MNVKILLATFVLALALAPAAMAATSSVDGYAGVGGQTQGSLDPAARTITDNGNTLPFTGYDALAIGGVGLLLAGLGVSLRLAQRRSDARV